jgi:glycosyltransferase involved in cell wall biosynthesis
MKFSIITCSYNSEKYIKKNIKSIKNQTFKNFEHIFIDAFSSDKTLEIIKKYQREFPEKVKLYQFKPQGISHAMNKGIEKSSGEYLIHLHSDDSFYDKNILKKVADFIKKENNPSWIYGKAKFINTKTNQSRIIPHRKIYRKIRFWLLLLTNYIPHQSVFLKKEVFEKYGKFDEKLKNSMDYDLWIRLSKNKVCSKFINQIICNFSVREDSQSTTGKNNNEHLLIHQKYLGSNLIINFLRLVDKINKRRKVL